MAIKGQTVDKTVNMCIKDRLVNCPKVSLFEK